MPLMLSRSFRKAAAQGDQGNDTTFEQAFSDMAHGYLREKAPRLMEYELGFQLLDRDDDTNRATGAFAFQAGSQYMLVPVFFINGAIKGMDILYLRNKDLYTPLDEDWVKMLLSRRPMPMGSSISRNLQQQGVRNPDLRQLSRPYHKFSALLDGPDRPVPVFTDWRVELRTTFAKMATDARVFEPLSLTGFVKQCDAAARDAFVDILQAYPAVAAGVRQFYPDAEIMDAVTAPRPQPAPPKQACCGMPTLRIYGVSVLGSYPPPAELTLADRRALVAGETVVKDDREPAETAKVYRTQLPEAHQNPTKTGVYEVLVVKSGDEPAYEKCFVGQLSNITGATHKCIVRRLSDNVHVLTDLQDVWTKGPEDTEATRKFWEDLPEATFEALSDGREHCLLSPSGDVLFPFSSFSKRRVAGRVNALSGHFAAVGPSRSDARRTGEYALRRGNPDPRAGAPDHYAVVAGERVPDHTSVTLCFDELSGPEFVSRDDGLYVPSGAKRLTLSGDDVVTSFSTKEAQLSLYSPRELQADFDRSTDLLEVAKFSADFLINSHKFDKTAALTELLTRWQLPLADAREVLDEARHLTKTAYRIKRAESPYLPTNGSYADTPPEQIEGSYEGRMQSSPMYERQLDVMPNDDLRAQGRDFNEFVEPQISPELAQQISRSVEHGDRQVLDAGLMGSAISAVSDEKIFEEDLGKLLKSVSEICRRLLMLYAHYDRFADKYGPENMPELEDLHQNAVTAVGKLVYKLHERSMGNMTERQHDFEFDMPSA